MEFGGCCDATGGGVKVVSLVKYGTTDNLAFSRAPRYKDLSVVTSRRWISACLMVCMMCMIMFFI